MCRPDALRPGASWQLALSSLGPGHHRACGRLAGSLRCMAALARRDPDLRLGAQGRWRRVPGGPGASCQPWYRN